MQGELEPALLGPLSLRPFRARRLSLTQVAGAPGEADRSVSAPLGTCGDVSLDETAALHVHEYRIDGRRVRGLVGLLDVQPDALTEERRSGAALLPHEAVDPDRVARLAGRMAELGLDPAPLLLLPLAPVGGGARAAGSGVLAGLLADVARRRPVVDGEDARRQPHRLWRVDDDAMTAALVGAVADLRLLLADGHHRWAAHLALASSPAGRASGHDRRTLVMVVDPVDHAPVLHALHRVVTGLEVESVLSALSQAGFRARRAAVVGNPAPPDAPLRVAHDEVVVAHGERRVRVRVPHDPSATVVERVHAALADLVPPDAWQHHHQSAAALRHAQRDPGAIALVLPPPALVEVAAAATAGRVLPVKATSFQPKPPLGLLLRSWRDG